MTPLLGNQNLQSMIFMMPVLRRQGTITATSLFLLLSLLRSKEQSMIARARWQHCKSTPSKITCRLRLYYQMNSQCSGYSQITMLCYLVLAYCYIHFVCYGHVHVVVYWLLLISKPTHISFQCSGYSSLTNDNTTMLLNISILLCFSEWTCSLILHSKLQTVISGYVTFVMRLDIHYVSRYIAKVVTKKVKTSYNLEVREYLCKPTHIGQLLYYSYTQF